MKNTITLFYYLFFCSGLIAQQIEVENSSGAPAIRTEGSAYNNSIELDNNSQSWRLTSWIDNDFLIVKTSGTTFSPFRIQDNSFSDALRLGSTGVGIGESLPSARLHVTAAVPEVLNLESNSQTTMSFYTGTTLQYRMRKLGSTSGDFQFTNFGNSNTVWVQNSGIAMVLRPTGYFGIGQGTDAVPDTRLHVTGDGDESLYEFEVEDDDYAFMQFDAALQSGIAFRNGASTNANAWYRGNANPGLIFNTASAGGTIHFFIEDNTGHVGIGDETPDAIFDIDGASDACNIGGRSGAEYGYLNVDRPSGSSNIHVQRWRDQGLTQAFVSLDASTYQFTVWGDAFATGGTWTNSDARLKDNVSDLGEGTLDRVLRLSPKYYDWKKDEQYEFLGLKDRRQIGFLAQELEVEFPEVVQTSTQTDADGEVAVDHELMSVNYSALVPVLTKAIQEQQEIIESLKIRIVALENK